MDKNFEPLKHGIALINLDAEEGKIKGAPEAIEKLSKLCHQPKGNAFSQLQQFRKMVPIILNYIIWQQKLLMDIQKSTIKWWRKCRRNTEKNGRRKKMNC